jgi:ubiquinone/menaquinone biosynthesis C-methylase UbiE
MKRSLFSVSQSSRCKTNLPLSHADIIIRMKASRKDTRQWYDRLSRWYDLFSSPWEGPWRRAALQTLDLQAGERVLEIGPGTGHGLAALARAAGPSGLVCGIDLSPGMLSVAAKRHRARETPSRVLLCVGDALCLPLPCESFEAVFASFVIELFDPQQVPLLLASLRSVLRPGGRLCAVSISAAGNSLFMRRLYKMAQQRFPKLIDCRPIHLAGSLAAAGFEIRSLTRRSSLDLPVEIVLGVKA